MREQGGAGPGEVAGQRGLRRVLDSGPRLCTAEPRLPAGQPGRGACRDRLLQRQAALRAGHRSVERQLSRTHPSPRRRPASSGSWSTGGRRRRRRQRWPGRGARSAVGGDRRRGEDEERQRDGRRRGGGGVQAAAAGRSSSLDWAAGHWAWADAHQHRDRQQQLQEGRCRCRAGTGAGQLSSAKLPPLACCPTTAAACTGMATGAIRA